MDAESEMADKEHKETEAAPAPRQTRSRFPQPRFPEPGHRSDLKLRRCDPRQAGTGQHACRVRRTGVESDPSVCESMPRTAKCPVRCTLAANKKDAASENEAASWQDKTGRSGQALSTTSATSATTSSTTLSAGSAGMTSETSRGASGMMTQAMR